MAYDRFMIAPINTGLETNVRPWIIPDDAFARLNNAYVFRGRVRKRFGSRLMVPSDGFETGFEQLVSRLRIDIGTTDGAGNFGPFIVPGAVWKIGQAFSVGNEIFTVFQAVGAVLSTGAGTGTFDTTTGTVTIAGATPLTTVFFYPSEPVMGLIVYEIGAVNDEPTYAFDTQFAYQFTNAGWLRLGTATWTGSDSDFFWGTTWRGIVADDNLLFVTNFNTPDQIKYWDGATWTNFAPVFNAAGDTIETARIIVVFHNRLVLLNVVENDGTNNSFFNRIRFSKLGDPIAADAFREDIPGRGDFLDAPVKQQIITAEFLKDRLIVYFESSTWELVYTGNEVFPFRWQQINTELGAESTFSVVPFDKVILGVGNVGIHACNGANVDRIDEKIPQEVFDIHNEDDGIRRVNGIRDYFVEMVYWTFPSASPTSIFPNRVLVYNYRTASWAFNDDSFTVFGYFQQQSSVTWASTSYTWEEFVDAWNSGALQAKFRQVIAGNQEGFVFIIDANTTRNAPSLQITNITYPASPPAPAGTVRITAIDHNLVENDYVIIENTNGITLPISGIYPVDSVFDADNFDIIAPDISGVYTGGGTVARASRIDVMTKQYNFYVKQGRNAYVQKVDFYVDKTDVGQLTIDYFTSAANLSLVTESTASGAILGTNVLETSPYASVPYEAQQSRLWHPVYLQADGECIQLRIYLSDEQMLNQNIVKSDFEMHAMTFYAMATSQRLQ